MTNSRLLMVASMTTIVGMYTLGIQRADFSVQAGAIGHGERVRAKQIARSGMTLGLTRMLKLGAQEAEVDALPVMEGTLSYSIRKHHHSHSASVVSRGSYHGMVIEVRGWFHEEAPGKWVLRKEHWQTVRERDPG